MKKKGHKNALFILHFARKANSNIRLNTSLLQNANMMARGKEETVNCILQNPCEIAKSNLSLLTVNIYDGLPSDLRYCHKLPQINENFLWRTTPELALFSHVVNVNMKVSGVMQLRL